MNRNAPRAIAAEASTLTSCLERQASALLRLTTALLVGYTCL